MADTVAYQILIAMRDRLQLITQSSGFNTDPYVMLGAFDVSQDEICPVIRVYETDDEPDDDGNNLCGDRLINLNIAIEGMIDANEPNASHQLSLLWQDIMRACFTTDYTIGGLALSVARGPREFSYPQTAGKTAAVRQVVAARYIEPYGNP